MPGAPNTSYAINPQYATPLQANVLQPVNVPNIGSPQMMTQQQMQQRQLLQQRQAQQIAQQKAQQQQQQQQQQKQQLQQMQTADTMGTQMQQQQQQQQPPYKPIEAKVPPPIQRNANRSVLPKKQPSTVPAETAPYSASSAFLPAPATSQSAPGLPPQAPTQVTQDPLLSLERLSPEDAPLLTGKITAVPEEELAQETLSSRPTLINAGFQQYSSQGYLSGPKPQPSMEQNKVVDPRVAMQGTISWEPQFILQESKMRELADKVVSKYGCTIETKTLRQFAATLQYHISDILEASLLASKRRRDTSVHKHFVNLSTVLSSATAQQFNSYASADDPSTSPLNNIEIASSNAGLKWGPDIRSMLREEAAQQAEVVASAKAALEDSLLAELRETDEVARKKSKKSVVSGPDTTEVSVQHH